MTKKKLISPVIVLIVFIYFYCVRGTALEAESSGIQPGTSYRSRVGLEKRRLRSDRNLNVTQRILGYVWKKRGVRDQVEPF